MERRIHGGRRDKFREMQSHVSLFNYILCFLTRYPSINDVGSMKSIPTSHDLEATRLFPSMSLAEEEHNDMEKRVQIDSSIIYRVTFRGACSSFFLNNPACNNPHISYRLQKLQGASLFIGRPSSEFTSSRSSKRHGTGPHDYVRDLIITSMLQMKTLIP